MGEIIFSILFSGFSLFLVILLNHFLKKEFNTATVAGPENNSNPRDHVSLNKRDAYHDHKADTEGEALL